MHHSITTCLLLTDWKSVISTRGWSDYYNMKEKQHDWKGDGISVCYIKFFYIHTYNIHVTSDTKW